MDKELSRWLQGELSNEELRNSIGSEDAIKFQQILDEVDKWIPDNSHQVFDPKTILQAPTKKAKVRSIQTWVPYSIAASILVLVASYFLFFNPSSIVTHNTGISEVKEILLPDGSSKIFLSPNSEVSWKREDWSQSQVAEKARLKKKRVKNRKVKLKGKALFSVEKGDPFTVHSAVGTVEVLGTTFEVDEFKSGMNVICFEGRVRAVANSKEVIVNGGDGYLFFDDEWEDKVSIHQSLPSWLNNETKFDNAPLTQVIKNLEKLYEINVNTGSVNIKRRFTGTIPNNKMEVAFKIVFDPFDIKYERKGDVLYLTE